MQRIEIPRMRAIVQTGAHSILLWISVHILLNLHNETDLSPLGIRMNVFSFNQYVNVVTVIHVLV